MATSNRERVDAGLRLLQAGLLPFVDATMSAQAPGGQDWVTLRRRGTTPSTGRRTSTRGRIRGSC